uniref:uncharacterized protein LOC128931381 n=1 Tax=Callithrix jacchus TaxID=9483 RepID=UPI0023DD31D2|nr:uncharacterized protein LOC128931381 [Callithrix jacchus]
MDERRPPSRGTGCLGNPRNPFCSPVGGTRGSRRGRESAERCPRGSSAPGAAEERSAAQRAPFLAAAAQPIAQTRRVQPTALAATGTQEAGLEASGTKLGWKYHALPLSLDPRSGHAGSVLKAGGCPRLGGGGEGKGRGWRPLPLLAPSPVAAAVAK